MKIFRYSFLMLAVVMAGIFTGHAQNTKKEKNAAKEAEMKALVDAHTFTFNAQTVNPMRGSTRQLTSSYDVRFVKDSVISYLPYFGRAFSAPITPDDAGLRFTSTKFSYVVTVKKSGWDIIIKPTDLREVRQLILSVSSNGYGTLSVNSTNRDPISFYGYIEANKKEK